ncbi:glycosyltransferase family 2 protein [Thalassovita mangrovi]|uniref:Glycosyltransferase family 2 protein n=1 Tax=Thalassovita mangrovi TaxID=2692236 RepID=A0A6L8LRB8_9RHOB|nr:glycosyltransferase family 2 protein [Thalassovita mangrovi]MYM56012.1 glycosyltransferase family 2 protein [Thalassovita mangrovi]
MSEQNKTTYPGGFDAIVGQMETRMAPFSYGPGEALPPLDADLQPLKHRMMDPAAPDLGESRSSYARKYLDLAKEFEGEAALLHLHGLLVANLRRHAQPPHTAQLFARLWAEEADFLMAHLDARWLVSAVTTFGDHGLTEAQRSLGQSLSVLFGMMKLYETERLFSGSAPDQPFAWKRKSAKHLAMQMDAYAITGGGLDINMLGRLWQEAEKDAVIRPLAQRLLSLLIEDDKTVFRRLRTMRARREKQRAAEAPPESKKKRNPAPVPASRQITDPAQIKWGTVSLIKAPLDRILRFAAHHLDLGAHRVHIYLDDPDPVTVEVLSLHPRIAVTACGATYWAAQKRGRMDNHRMRQVWVATEAYNSTDCHWLAHIDVDEFLLPQDRMADHLARVDADKIALHLPPAEQLAGQGDEAFKLAPRAAGRPASVLQDIYPTFGMHLRGGFISHIEGKLFVRTGIEGLRFGIHAIHWQGAPVTNIQSMPGVYLGHAHAPTFDGFIADLDFRMSDGSYRKTEDEDKFRFSDVVDFLIENEGEEGLKMFYQEVCTLTPELARKLGENGMLVEYPLRLEEKTSRVFGPYLEGQ